MSAFVVNTLTLNAAIQAILVATGPRSTASADRLGRDLWAMNNEAVKICYAHSPHLAEVSISAEQISTFTFQHVTSDLAVMVKCLDCFMYQCCEDGVVTRPLFLEIERLQEALSKICPDTSPAYNAAPWGLVA